jgi:hypothetical protein
MYFAVLHINFISAGIILDLSCSLITPVLDPYNKVGNAEVLHIFSLESDAQSSPTQISSSPALGAICSHIWGSENPVAVV